jgi:hypothetical protein
MMVKLVAGKQNGFKIKIESKGKNRSGNNVDSFSMNDIGRYLPKAAQYQRVKI